MCLCVCQMGEPTAVFLLSCSTQTLTSRLQSRRSSASAMVSAPDKDGAPCWRAGSFRADVEPVVEHYDGKKLLHTVSASWNDNTCRATRT